MRFSVSIYILSTQKGQKCSPDMFLCLKIYSNAFASGASPLTSPRWRKSAPHTLDLREGRGREREEREREGKRKGGERQGKGRRGEERRGEGRERRGRGKGWPSPETAGLDPPLDYAVTLFKVYSSEARAPRAA